MAWLRGHLAEANLALRDTSLQLLGKQKEQEQKEEVPKKEKTDVVQGLSITESEQGGEVKKESKTIVVKGYAVADGEVTAGVKGYAVTDGEARDERTKSTSGLLAGWQSRLSSVIRWAVQLALFWRRAAR